MATFRTALVGACMALAMLTAGACQQLNEAISDRDLECGEEPEDICIRLADEILAEWGPGPNPRDGPLVKVTVMPHPCDVIHDPAVARCWYAEGTSARNAAGGIVGLGGVYYERRDGSLLTEDGRPVGS